MIYYQQIPNKESVILIYVIGFFFLFSLACDFPKLGYSGKEKGFNSKMWIESDKETGTRHMMFEDLKNNYLNKIKKQKEIMILLGTLDEIKEEKYFFYLMSYGLDPCYLILAFKDNELINIETYECE